MIRAPVLGILKKYLNEELDTSISKTTIQRIISSYKTSSEKINKVEVGEDIKQVQPLSQGIVSQVRMRFLQTA